MYAFGVGRYSDLHAALINKIEQVKVSQNYMTKEHKGLKYHFSSVLSTQKHHLCSLNQLT